MASDCGSCSKNLAAEAANKDEEDMTESERKLASGEAELEDLAPSFLGAVAYGPLSDWDGDYCHFCFNIGLIGSAIIGVAVFYFLIHFYPYWLSGYVGGGVSVTLMYIVGKIGRFPVLGALFGPIVEAIFARGFGVYLTAAAEQKYKGEIAETAKGRSMQSKAFNNIDMVGPQMYLVTTERAKSECWDVSAPGALLLVRKKNDQIVEVQDFHSNDNFNNFQNIQDLVGVGREHLCQGTKEPVTRMQFAEMLESGGRRGIE